ncbi:MAG: SusC/RagA family TonB-linked outer membrane protein [Candidatus Cryptobacteroides sp.]
MKKVVLFFMSVFAALSLNAQNLKISGTVTDSEGNPLPGVTVQVEGTGIGTVTDSEGKYIMTIRQEDKVRLVYSCVGMQTMLVPVAGKTVVDVTLAEDTIGLSQAVVTATGLTRSEKALGYASTTVKAEDITRGHAVDALTGLAGKVAGVQISSAGGTGTSQKVIVRGYSSLAGSNQPLYIIDGVPVSNTTMGVQDLNNAIDFGNAASDLNPDDIESITVLKGASATALYGSRAGNGAVIITTKKGLQNEDISVTWDGAVTGSSVLRIPQLQNRFGQGWNYSYEGNLLENWSPTENGSWGNLLDGRDHYWRPGANWYNGAEESIKPFSYAENSLKNFYETGLETSNTITVKGGSQNTGFVVSYGNVYSNGILPGDNDYFKRNTFSARGNTKIGGGRAWLNYSLNYVNKNVRNNMSGQGGDGSTIYQDILQYPVDIDYADLKDYNSIYNNADNFYTPYAQNPWWILDHNYSEYKEDRVYGNIEAGLQIVKGLKAIARVGADVSDTFQSNYNDLWTFNSGSYADKEGASAEIGSYSEERYRSSQLDANFLLNADYRIQDVWTVNAVAGVNVNERSSEYTAGSLSGLAVSEWPSFLNTSGMTPTSSSYKSLRRLVGAYAQADLGYMDGLYFTLSARNDWSSTLPAQNRSFFYWGTNVSAILTELVPALKSDVLSFLKFRAGYGQTGNDASPYLTSSYYYLPSVNLGFGSLTMPLDGYSGLIRSSRLPATSLKPEISTEAEFGVDVRLFDNRLSFDVALYDKKTSNQIISATLAPESGYTSSVRNVGLIQNRGIELSVGVVPVRTKDVEWNIGYTFSKNGNKVLELWDDVQETTIYGLTSGPQLMAIVGESLGTWQYYKTETVKEEDSEFFGKTIVNATTGLPVVSSTDKVTLGKADNDFNMGLNTSLRYKNLILGAAFDYRKGGLMYSATASITYFNGNAEKTMFNDRDTFVYPDAVYVRNGEYVENDLPVNSYYPLYGYYYSNYNKEAYAWDLLDKTYLKLRELSLTYQLPRKWFDSLGWLTGVDLSVFGRNLLMWTPNQGIIDPDVTNYGSDLTSQYGEYYAAPSTRTFGASVKVVF